MDALAALKERISDHRRSRESGWNDHPFFIYSVPRRWFGVRLPGWVNGPQVVHLTPKREAILRSYGNRIALRLPIDPKKIRATIDQFLFIVSPEFDPWAGTKAARKAKRRWRWRNWRIRYDLAAAGIKDYMTAAFIDSPSGSWKPPGCVEEKEEGKEERKPTLWDDLKHATPPAVWSKLMNEFYGMQPREAQDTPYPQLFQYYWAAIDRLPSDSGKPSVTTQYRAAANWIKKQARQHEG